MAASKEFWSAFESGGQNTAVCICKRTHFATGYNSCLGDTEWEELRESVATDPDLYIEHSTDDSVCVSSLQGGIVYGCPCKADERLEGFLVANQSEIIAFFRKRAERQRSEAAAAMEGLEAMEANQ